MATKPTHEELELKNTALEKEALEFRQADKAHKEQEKLLNDVFESIQDGISVLDSELNIIRVNQAMKKWYAHMLPLEGKKCYQAYHGRDRVCEHCPTTRALKTGNLEMNEVPLSRADGMSGTLELFAFPMLNHSGRPTGVVEYVRDVTQRKSAEAALGKVFDELEQRVEQRTAELRRTNEKLEQEIEDRKRTEKALREKENTLKAILLASPVGIGLVRDRAFDWANRSMYRLLGYRDDFLIGKDAQVLYPTSEEYERVGGKLYSEVKENGFGKLDTLWVTNDGKIIDCHLQASALDPTDLSRGVIIAAMDTTERKRTEKALRESEEQKRAILDASIDKIRYVDRDLRVIWANKTAADAAKMPLENFVGKTCYQLFVGRNAPCRGCPSETARKSGKMERAVVHQSKLNGIEGDSYWDNYSVPLNNDAGKIEGFIQIARNITDQKRAEEHIHTLTQELMRAQESERQRISRDLHDHVAQELSALKIGYETLFDNTPGIPSKIRRKVSEMSKIFVESINAVRDLAYNLRPPVLDEMGLVQALLQYCHDFSENNGIIVDFHSAGMKDLKLDFDTEINLYRIIQEALANIKKHANASLVTVRIVVAFPNVILRIKDNGKGFDVQKRLTSIVKEKRMGIRSMEERVKLLKGNMEIQSKPNQGTKISIKFPHKDKKRGS